MFAVTAEEEQQTVERVPKQLYIDGVWRPGNGGTTAVEGPATGAVLCEVADASPDDAVAALDAATRAGPSWREYAPREGAEILRGAFDMIVDRSDELVLLMTLEMGKPLAEQ